VFLFTIKLIANEKLSHGGYELLQINFCNLCNPKKKHTKKTHTQLCNFLFDFSCSPIKINFKGFLAAAAFAGKGGSTAARSAAR
jgi:hypothetical protein